MNKKLVCVLMSAATLLSGTAFADFDPQFYVGGEAIANRLGFSVKNTPKSIKKVKVGGGAFVGTRFHENVGLEAGYGFLGSSSVTSINDNDMFNSRRKDTTKRSNAYADVMGYLPIDCATDLIGSVGVGHLHSVGRRSWTFENKVTAEKVVGRIKKNRDSMGARVGIGAQYKFTDNIGARVMVNYQHAKKGVVKHVATARLGMFYQF